MREGQSGGIAQGWSREGASSRQSERGERGRAGGQRRCAGEQRRGDRRAPRGGETGEERERKDADTATRNKRGKRRRRERERADARMSSRTAMKEASDWRCTARSCTVRFIESVQASASKHSVLLPPFPLARGASALAEEEEEEEASETGGSWKKSPQTMSCTPPKGA
eukprot:2237703-Rhodomonas_salina.1